MRYLGKNATVANVARPVRKQADVALVLVDRMRRTAIGFELEEEFGKTFLDIHSDLLGFGLGICQPLVTNKEQCTSVKIQSIPK